jgi:hypothetical protein
MSAFASSKPADFAIFGARLIEGLVLAPQIYTRFYIQQALLELQRRLEIRSLASNRGSGDGA